jgi:hypothetical protein
MGSAGTRRDAALAWADAARAARRRVRHDLSGGATTLPDVLAAADPFVAEVRLQWVLESLPGARKTDTRRALAHHALDGDLPLGRLTDAERTTVLAVFGAGPDAS